MKEEQPITIDSDTARRMGLNAERNPRATYDPLRPSKTHKQWRSNTNP